MYSNITFTDKQKEDLFKLYDCLQSNGIIDSVIMNMAEGEYEELYNLLNKTLEDKLHYDNTAAGVINNLIESLPAQAEEMQKIVDNFDKEKFKNVLDFAKSANAGRPV
jgi:hypothetical protein